MNQIGMAQPTAKVREKLSLMGELQSNQDQLERLHSNIREIESMLFTQNPEDSSPPKGVSVSAVAEMIIEDSRSIIDKCVKLTERILSRLN